MKFVMLLALLASFSAFAQTNTEATTPAATTPAQDQMGSPAAGESSMAGPETTKHSKKHKAHKAGKKKHHKKKKHHATPAS